MRRIRKRANIRGLCLGSAVLLLPFLSFRPAEALQLAGSSSIMAIDSSPGPNDPFRTSPGGTLTRRPRPAGAQDLNAAQASQKDDPSASQQPSKEVKKEKRGSIVAAPIQSPVPRLVPALCSPARIPFLFGSSTRYHNPPLSGGPFS
jgi:hypothetical protein